MTMFRNHALRRWALPLLALGALTACDDETTPPFEVEGTGQVEGLLFYDANDDGLFDPAAGDEALPGVQLAVLTRGTQEVLAGAQAVTDAEGRFLIDAVPLGTHDLLIDETSIPEDLVFCRNPVPVSVYRNETEFADLDAARSCLITIAEAEAEGLGAYVTVSGIVTAAPGMIRGDYTHIEDETGAIRIFGSALGGQDVEVGDRIEVSGTIGEYGGDLQVSYDVLNSLEKDVADPEPQVVTTGQITEAGVDPLSDLVGRFVRVEAAEMVAAFGSGDLHGLNALIDSGEGEDEAIIRVEGGVASEDELADLMTVGSCYDIVGVIGTFGGEGQIFPRSTADIVEVACP